MEKRRKLKRYFIVNYICTKGELKGTGQISVKSKEGKYVNQKRTEEFLENDKGITGVVITNIIELNKRDFDEYFK